MPHPAAPQAGWFPVSPCGPACLPAEVPRAPWRFAVRVCALAVALACALVGISLLPAGVRDRWLRACNRTVLAVSGVRLRVTGELGAGGELVVVNHMSWIEILAVGTLGPARMIAKREMGEWPLIGGVARRTGALFLDRGGLRALPRTVADTAVALRGGDRVVVYPEGTTWCGAAAGPFRRAVFQAAIDAAAPIRPIAVTLRLPDGRPAPEATFIGEETLWDALLRVLVLPAIECELTILPAIPPTSDRRDLADRTATAIAAVTGVPHPGVTRQHRQAHSPAA